ncbi:hypothetical protein ACVR05_01135 [Streptococcus caprae]|uniref:Uncharacterized protein n=1 Tax=Streptococcus caprae TaxID=1640501 RepID=A0ABV8CUR3_9STRE
MVDEIMKLRYIGESFGVDSLTNGRVYTILEILPDDLVRVVDDSGEAYLYSYKNPRPLDESSVGGYWEIP